MAEPLVGEPPIGSWTPLDGVREFITRYVALTDTQADAVTLWCAHTWAFEAAETTPYIAVQSVEPGSGKTRLLEVCEQIVAHPWLCSRTTGPALCRRLGAEKNTLLLDETDALFTGGNASQQMLRGVLNAGYRMGGTVSYAQGGGYVTLDVFAPKMFAGLTDLPATVKDRSIPIMMRKRTAFDKVERLRIRDIKAEAYVPRMLLLRFGAMHLATLAEARPEIPEGLDDRAADVWEPLLAIADVAGDDWPQRAREAALELMKARKAANTSGAAFTLLSAVHDCFVECDVDRLMTKTILDALLGTPAATTLDGRALDARALADNLRAFGVVPRKVRFGKQALQGYMRFEVENAWKVLIQPADSDEALSKFVSGANDLERG